MQVRWGRVLVVVGLVLAAAYRRQIAALLAQLGLGAVWSDFAAEIQCIPRRGHYAMVLSVLALLFLTGYFLVLNSVRKGGRP
jgi:hypothetical protein